MCLLGTGCDGEPRQVLYCQVGHSLGGWQTEITRGSSLHREAPSGALYGDGMPRGLTWVELEKVRTKG